MKTHFKSALFFLYLVSIFAFTSCKKVEPPIVKGRLMIWTDYDMEYNFVSQINVSVNGVSFGNLYDRNLTQPNCNSTLGDPVLLYDNTPGTYTITAMAAGVTFKPVINQILSNTCLPVRIVTATTNQIISYSNITLNGLDAISTGGIYYSTRINTIYNSIQLANASAKEQAAVDIVYIGDTGGLSFFANPSQSSSFTGTTISGLKTVAVINKMTNAWAPSFSVQDFDSMVDDSKLRSLNIAEDKESFSLSSSTVFPFIVLFKNQYNKIGAIKVKSGTSGRFGSITFDIKMQQ